MFVNKKDIDHSKYELLEDVSKMDYQQIMKHYFNDVDIKTRKRFLSFILEKRGALDSNELNIEAHRLLLEIKQREAQELPELVHAIITSTLAFEANEELKNTLYKDYKDKNISKHAKPFIGGLYKIFRNTYENLFNVNEKQVLKISKDLEDVVNALVYTKLTPEELIKLLKQK